MIDFSRGGYGGGDVAISWVPVAVALDPVAGGDDDRARIQEAIDTISTLPLPPADLISSEDPALRFLSNNDDCWRINASSAS